MKAKSRGYRPDPPGLFSGGLFFAVCEIVRADALERCAERGKRGIGCLRVRRVCLDEKIDVPREAGLRVIDNRKAAYNEVFNAMGMEDGQKVFVVLVHPAPSPNL